MPQLPAWSPPAVTTAPTRGCVCPPKAEETCRSLNCGRRGVG
jgi:hypothetical protein